MTVVPATAPVASPPVAELVSHRFVPTVVYVREGGGLHTRICLYNYFSELFPDVRTGAIAHLWFFRHDGTLVAHREIALGYKGQLQFEVAELGVEFEGTCGVAMVPETLPEIRHKGVGTGYYVYYHDDAGHADYSHEWDPMKFAPTTSPPWICVVRPRLFPESELVVLNAYYGDDPEAGVSRWTIRLRDAQGKVLAERAMPPIAARGCARVALADAIPELAALAERHGTVAVEAQGTNMMGPFTFVRAASGDFNFHHFC